MPPIVDEVRLSFDLVSTLLWRSQAACAHGTAELRTQVGSSGSPPLNHVAWVSNVMRHHQLTLGCGCSQPAPVLNASVAYGPSAGVEAGTLRIIAEQSATLEPPGVTNFYPFHGRLTCRRTGAYYLDAKVQLTKSVASGARGMGQVFAAGNPPMFSVSMIDVGGKATAVLRGAVNLYANQPLAIAFLNTGTASQDVALTTLTVSDVWVPS